MNKDNDKTKAQLLIELSAGQAELIGLRKKSKEQMDNLKEATK
ncbi:MAG: hypothetical protein U9R32_02705 [Bacteroidota bacterium]|nr:hypothetical protein [Bacteroidota bacterium]